jgi:hypothetical protein
MQHFIVDTAIHHNFLLVARQITTTVEGAIRPYTFYNYIDNLHYHIKFFMECTRYNLILEDPIHGHLFACIEAIFPGQAYPPDDVNNWIVLQHEDVLIGEGGSGVIRPMEGLGEDLAYLGQHRNKASGTLLGQSRPDMNNTHGTVAPTSGRLIR